LDIAYLIRKEAPEFRWERLVERARESNASKAVYYVLSFLGKADYCAVPEAVLGELGAVSLNFLEKRNFCLLMENRRTNVSGDLMSYG